MLTDGAAIRGSGDQATRRREAMFCVALLVLVAIDVFGRLRVNADPNYYPFDLRAFYCGGRVLLERGDPYRVEPLRTCEAALPGRGSARFPLPATAVPVPLPGYALAALAPLALLPPPAAKFTFFFAELAAAGFIGLVLSRMTLLPWAVGVAYSYTTIGVLAIEPGEVAIFAIAAVAASAYAVSRGRPVVAALAACAALVQPQFGIWVVLALFAFVPRGRVAIACCVAALAAVNLAVLGPATAWEYLRATSVHARSEIASNGQYSATWLAHVTGASDGLALSIGAGTALLGLVVVFAILARVRDRANRPAIVLLPAAFAVLGGTFIHTVQLVVATLPALIVMRPLGRWNYLASLALVLFVMPWEAVPGVRTITSQTAVLVLLALAVGWTIVYSTRRIAGATAPAPVATAMMILGAGYLAVLRSFHSQGVVRRALPTWPHDRAALASSEWARYVAYNAAHDPFHLLMTKLPTWLALLIVVGGSSYALLRKVPAKSGLA